jgi:hypothetical protein
MAVGIVACGGDDGEESSGDDMNGAAGEGGAGDE